MASFSVDAHARTQHHKQHYSSLKLNARLKPRHGGGANNSAAKICVLSTCVHPAFVCVCVRWSVSDWDGWREVWLPTDAGCLSDIASVCLSVLCFSVCLRLITPKKCVWFFQTVYLLYLRETWRICCTYWMNWTYLFIEFRPYNIIYIVHMV